MSKSAFLTSLQDLVFGLFGSLAMLVVVFSIFSEGEHSFQDRFLLVRLEWDINQLKGMSDDQLAAALNDVHLRQTSGNQIRWSLQSSPRTLRDMIDEGVPPKSLHHVDETYAAELLGEVDLQLPTAVEWASIRTRGGQSRNRGGGSLRIDVE